MSIVLRSFLRSVVRRRALTLVQLSGVAAVVGMVLASNTSLDSFGRAVEFLQGKSTHALSQPVGPMSESVLVKIMTDSKVTSFGPVLDRRVGLEDGSTVDLWGQAVYCNIPD
jgi:hypothetical protein